MQCEKMFTPEMHIRYTQLLERLRACGRVAIAYSGGADSTLLLKAAMDALAAEDVLAIIIDTPGFPRRELDEARNLAGWLGARAEVITVDALGDPAFAANTPERCYFCKRALFGHVFALAADHGFSCVIDGSNADDSHDWRPGERAAHELGVVSPLRELGIPKAEVRALSCAMDPSTAEKPAAACLVSRLPYGVPITAEALAQIEAAEQALRDLGFSQLRVRHHGDVARLELLPADLPRALDLRETIVATLRAAGYAYVALDLQGYRMGSMNEGL